jgi:hypothetical protein
MLDFKHRDRYPGCWVVMYSASGAVGASAGLGPQPSYNGGLGLKGVKRDCACQF